MTNEKKKDQKAAVFLPLNIGMSWKRTLGNIRTPAARYGKPGSDMSSDVFIKNGFRLFVKHRFLIDFYQNILRYKVFNLSNTFEIR